MIHALVIWGECRGGLEIPFPNTFNFKNSPREDAPSPPYRGPPSNLRITNPLSKILLSQVMAMLNAVSGDCFSKKFSR